MVGITIDGKHTYDDYGLILKTYNIPYPEAKTETVSIPYASGSVDLTESAGYVPYEDRSGIKFEFLLKTTDYETYNRKMQALAKAIHGQKLKVILDTDPAYYYLARLEISSEKTDKQFANVTLEGTSDPFKYAVLASNEPWLWDSFSFVDGVISETTSDIDINGTKEVTITAGEILTAPTFYVYSAENLTVTDGENTYELTKTSSAKAYETYRFPQLRVGDTDVTLTFTGKGRVSIAYRGRYL